MKIGLAWRHVRRRLHDRFGSHTGVVDAKYGRVCDRCYLPVYRDGDVWVLKARLVMHPPIGKPSLTRIPRKDRR